VVLVFPDVAVAVDVLPVVDRQVETIVPCVISLGVELAVVEDLADDHQIGAGRNRNLVPVTVLRGQRDEVVERLVEVGLVGGSVDALAVYHLGRDGEIELGGIDTLEFHVVDLHCDRVRGWVMDRKGLGVGLTGHDDVGEAGVIFAPIVAGLPVGAGDVYAIFAAGHRRAPIGVHRTAALGVDVVVQIGGGGHEQRLGRG